MTPAFDPYLEWLQIPGARRPPKDYELLGLAAGELDVDRIQTAYQERYAFVRRYQNGLYSETAHKILHELSCASESMKAVAIQREIEFEPRLADVERYEPYEPEDLSETAGSFDDTKPTARGTPQTILAAFPQESLQAQTDLPQIPSESSGEPSDERHLPGEDEFLSKVVTVLAVACGISAFLGLWLPDVTIYFVSLAIVFGCWHFCNAFNSPPWRVLGGHIRTWAKAKASCWAARRACSAKVETHRRSVKGLQLSIKSLVGQQSALPASKRSELDDVRKRTRETQLRSFLRSHTVRDNLDNIPNVGKGRLEALESCGISTAYEVQYERIVSITGCDALTASGLVAWRTNVTRRFRFNVAAMPTGVLLEIEQKYARQEQQINHELTRILSEVRSLNQASQREMAPLAATLQDTIDDKNHAWAAVRGQMGSLTTPFVVMLLTAFVIPTSVLMIVRTFD